MRSKISCSNSPLRPPEARPQWGNTHQPTESADPGYSFDRGTEIPIAVPASASPLTAQSLKPLLLLRLRVLE